MDITQSYYQNNSQEFFDSTVEADVNPLYERFLRYVPIKGHILDVGCGSGRDTKAFIDMGYSVDAIDGSEELCALASRYTGIAVKCMDFTTIDFVNEYDALWACASLLHVSSDKLPGVVARLCKVLHPEGILYMSFKYGDFEGERDGRFFLDMTEERFETFLKEVEGIKVEEMWISSDVRPGRGEEKWLNMILRKKLK